MKQLAYFVRVAELGSFTRASIALGISLIIVQPALNRLLEVGLRQNLLTRNGRGALPTKAGHLLRQHARAIAHRVPAVCLKYHAWKTAYQRWPDEAGKANAIDCIRRSLAPGAI